MPDFFEVTVVGMRFHNKEQKQALRMPCLTLKPEPENKHDPNAILVVDPATDEPIGHVSRDTQTEVPPLPPQGKSFDIYICEPSGLKAVKIIAIKN